jgi:hypothetical protein
VNESGTSEIILSGVKVTDPAGVPVELNVTSGILNIDPGYDLNQDGIVDISDIVIVSQHFGESA